MWLDLVTALLWPRWQTLMTTAYQWSSQFTRLVFRIGRVLIVGSGYYTAYWRSARHNGVDIMMFRLRASGEACGRPGHHVYSRNRISAAGWHSIHRHCAEELGTKRWFLSFTICSVVKCFRETVYSLFALFGRPCRIVGFKALVISHCKMLVICSCIWRLSSCSHQSPEYSVTKAK